MRRLPLVAGGFGDIPGSLQQRDCDEEYQQSEQEGDSSGELGVDRVAAERDGSITADVVTVEDGEQSVDREEGSASEQDEADQNPECAVHGLIVGRQKLPEREPFDSA